MWEAFAVQKLLTFFQQKYWHILDISVWNFNETLTNDIIRFEQPGPGLRVLSCQSYLKLVLYNPTTLQRHSMQRNVKANTHDSLIQRVLISSKHIIPSLTEIENFITKYFILSKVQGWEQIFVKNKRTLRSGSLPWALYELTDLL